MRAHLYQALVELVKGGRMATRHIARDEWRIFCRASTSHCIVRSRLKIASTAVSSSSVAGAAVIRLRPIDRQHAEDLRTRDVRRVNAVGSHLSEGRLELLRVALRPFVEGAHVGTAPSARRPNRRGRRARRTADHRGDEDRERDEVGRVRQLATRELLNRLSGPVFDELERPLESVRFRGRPSGASRSRGEPRASSRGPASTVR